MTEDIQMRRLTVRVTEAQYDYLRSVQRAHGIGMASQIREMLRRRIQAEVPRSRTGKLPSGIVPDARIVSVNDEVRRLIESGEIKVAS